MQVWVRTGDDAAGRLLEDPGAPAISVADHGFTVGDGVFEAVKVVRGEPFALSRHLRRLARSATALGLPEPDEVLVREGVAAVLGAEPRETGRLRITVTGGPAPMGSGRGDHAPTLVVAVSDLVASADAVDVHVVDQPRNERGVLAGVKSTSYAENVVALAEAARHDAQEAVFGNLAGHLCEGTGSNVGYVVAGEVRTPTLASGCLAGITRELLLEWADVVEVDEPLEVVATADEVFLMSTTRDVQPVRRWAGRALPAPGPVTRQLQQRWREREAEQPDP